MMKKNLLYLVLLSLYLLLGTHNSFAGIYDRITVREDVSTTNNPVTRDTTPTFDIECDAGDVGKSVVVYSSTEYSGVKDTVLGTGSCDSVGTISIVSTPLAIDTHYIEQAYVSGDGSEERARYFISLRVTGLQTNLEISMSDGSNTQTTDLVYSQINEATTDFDNGYDSSIFGGLGLGSFVLYTDLVSDINNSERKLGIQMLPYSNLNDSEVALGVIAPAGSNLSFSLSESVDLPSDVKVFIEDRLLGTTTEIVAGGTPYTATANADDADAEGTGRFYFRTEFQDTTKPVISLIGDATVTVLQNAAYSDAGATASDETDGDITGDIVTVNPVDTSVVGTYTITYNVSDSAGNTAIEVTREVIVQDPAANNRADIELSMTNSGNTKTTDIFYAGTGVTNDFDNNQDLIHNPLSIPGEGFSSPAFDFYSGLVADAGGLGYKIGTQGVPYTTLEHSEIPLGVSISSTDSVTFTLATTANLPSTVETFIEDRLLNVYTQLEVGGAGYTVSVNHTDAEIGRFYFHTATSLQAPTTAADLQAVSDLGASNTDNLTSNALPSFDLSCSQIGNTLKIYTNNPANNTLAGTHNCTSVGIETATITSTLSQGMHQIHYTETNTLGSESSASPILSMTIDTVKPSVSLVGNANITLAQNASYTDAGATASDETDGNITANIVTVNPVDTSVLGTYTVTYNVSDLAGNAATQVTRTVQVVDQTKPIITLIGDASITLAQNASYTDAGATASDDTDGNITANIVTVNPVDTSVLGTYTITYNVSDSAGNAATQVTRTINVVDQTKPIITLIGDASVTLAQNASYTDAGATASDDTDGNITANIVTVNPVDTSVLGTYTITYNVSDLAGNTATEVTRTVQVVDQTKPVITLVGNPTTTVLQNATYIDAGATASDDTDGNITANIVTVNPVDTSVLGTYTIRYNVSDLAGNAATEVTRTVHVVDQTIPIITLVGNANITVLQNSTYSDAGATASDDADGDITANIVTVNPVDTSVLGTYTVTYNVSDSAGNAAIEVTRTVEVSLGDAPVITLNGLRHQAVEKDVFYTDPGLTVTDTEDGIIPVPTASITNSSGASIADFATMIQTLDTYTLTYSVTDTTSNTSTATRKVTVIDTSSTPDEDLDQVDNTVEQAASNNGDANGDGQSDAIQEHVASFPNAVTTRFNAIETVANGTNNACRLTSASNIAVTSLGALDPSADYPYGLWDFSTNCGSSIDVTIYLDQVYNTHLWQYKKYDAITETYTDISAHVTYGTATVGATTVTTISYTVVDNGPLDQNPAVGEIQDPSGPAIPVATATARGGGTPALEMIYARLPQMRKCQHMYPSINYNQEAYYKYTACKQKQPAGDSCINAWALEVGASLSCDGTIAANTTKVVTERVLYREDSEEEKKTAIDKKTTATVFTRQKERKGTGIPVNYYADDKIAQRNPYYDALVDLTEQGIVTGRISGENQQLREAALQDTITRSEVVKLYSLAREDLIEQQELPKTHFIDTIANAWYMPYIAHFTHQGIIEGYPNGTFQPSKAISLAENYKIAALSFELISAEQASKIAKENQLPWYIPYKNSLLEKGILAPDIAQKNDELAITRGELMDILSKTLQLIDEINVQ